VEEQRGYRKSGASTKSVEGRRRNAEGRKRKGEGDTEPTNVQCTPKNARGKESWVKQTCLPGKEKKGGGAIREMLSLSASGTPISTTFLKRN